MPPRASCMDVEERGKGEEHLLCTPYFLISQEAASSPHSHCLQGGGRLRAVTTLPASLYAPAASTGDTSHAFARKARCSPQRKVARCTFCHAGSPVVSLPAHFQDKTFPVVYVTPSLGLNLPYDANGDSLHYHQCGCAPFLVV